MTSIKPKIGKHCIIASDVELGDQVVVHGFANLYGCQIGDDCRIGTFVEIQKDVTLGKRVRIQSHTFICSGVRYFCDIELTVIITPFFFINYFFKNKL